MVISKSKPKPKASKPVVSKPKAPRKPPPFLALVFDTETTGLIENHTVRLDRQPHIIEWYSCLADLNDGRIISEIDTFLKPPLLKLDDITTKITHITMDMLVDAPKFADVADRIRSSISEAPLVIAHNASYDVEMTDIEFERLGQVVVWPRALCTVEQTVHVKGYRLSLTNLHHELFGEDFPEAHRAKTDVAALLRCAVELRKRDWI